MRITIGNLCLDALVPALLVACGADAGPSSSNEVADTDASAPAPAASPAASPVASVTLAGGHVVEFFAPVGVPWASPKTGRSIPPACWTTPPSAA